MSTTRMGWHRCQGGYVEYGSPLIGPALRFCAQCRDVCTVCRNGGCFAPAWIGNPVAVAEAIVFAAAHGHGLVLCVGCGGVLDMTHLWPVEGDDVMSAVRIGRTAMTGDTSGHRADREGDRWRVSWLPDRRVTYNQAVTALTIAETVATTPDLGPGHRLWPHVTQWAAELDLSGTDALALAVDPAIRTDRTRGDQP